ncbi:hypothetical protein WDW86_21290 [Bdellovibrionota bacterium FG-2]
MANFLFDFDGVLVRARGADKRLLWSKDIEKDLGVSLEVVGELFKQPQWN